MEMTEQRQAAAHWFRALRDEITAAFETFGASLLQGQPRTFRLSTSIDL